MTIPLHKGQRIYTFTAPTLVLIIELLLLFLSHKTAETNNRLSRYTSYSYWFVDAGFEHLMSKMEVAGCYSPYFQGEIYEMAG